MKKQKRAIKNTLFENQTSSFPKPKLQKRFQKTAKHDWVFEANNTFFENRTSNGEKTFAGF